MNAPNQTNSDIITYYRAKTPGSGALFERARKVLPSGITHDARYLEPYSIHVGRARGPRKWDVDGNEYVDYFGGHGAMLLGHSHPAVVEAVQKQMALGTHYGSSHELEVRWAELVCELAHFPPMMLYAYLRDQPVKRVIFINLSREHRTNLQWTRHLAGAVLRKIPHRFARDQQEFRF